MRIIAGERKKMQLFGPETLNIRPTTDRAKESLFNLISMKIEDATFIDLFAGTGSISLEAKSRGAKNVYAIDYAPESASIVKKNQEKSKLEIKFLNQKVEYFIQETSIIADIIFMDPPFDMEDSKILDIVNTIYTNKLLKEDGILIIERKSKIENKDIFKEYKNVEIRKYGKVSFILIGER